MKKILFIFLFFFLFYLPVKGNERIEVKFINDDDVPKIKI